MAGPLTPEQREIRYGSSGAGISDILDAVGHASTATSAEAASSAQTVVPAPIADAPRTPVTPAETEEAPAISDYFRSDLEVEVLTNGDVFLSKDPEEAIVPWAQDVLAKKDNAALLFKLYSQASSRVVDFDFDGKPDASMTVAEYAETRDGQKFKVVLSPIESLNSEDVGGFANQAIALVNRPGSDALKGLEQKAQNDPTLKFAAKIDDKKITDEQKKAAVTERAFIQAAGYGLQGEAARAYVTDLLRQYPNPNDLLQYLNTQTAYRGGRGENAEWSKGPKEFLKLRTIAKDGDKPSEADEEEFNRAWAAAIKDKGPEQIWGHVLAHQSGAGVESVLKGYRTEQDRSLEIMPSDFGGKLKDLYSEGEQNVIRNTLNEKLKGLDNQRNAFESRLAALANESQNTTDEQELVRLGNERKELVKKLETVKQARSEAYATYKKALPDRDAIAALTGGVYQSTEPTWLENAGKQVASVFESPESIMKGVEKLSGFPSFASKMIGDVSGLIDAFTGRKEQLANLQKIAVAGGADSKQVMDKALGRDKKFDVAMKFESKKEKSAAATALAKGMEIAAEYLKPRDKKSQQQGPSQSELLARDLRAKRGLANIV